MKGHHKGEGIYRTISFNVDQRDLNGVDEVQSVYRPQPFKSVYGFAPGWCDWKNKKIKIVFF